MTWHVLHTKSRQEKALTSDLAALDIDYFLPMVEQVRYYGKRKARVNLPLFPGYVFMKGQIDQAYQADRTRRVANILPVSDQDKLEQELDQIRRVLNQKITLEPYPFLAEGMEVEVRSGPLRGTRGKIEKRTNQNRLVLQVEMIGQASSLEIEGSLLDPVA